MGIEYDGEVVVEINGKEVDISSLDITVSKSRKPVKTMNRTGRAKGSTKGITMYDLKITAPIPQVGGFDWENMVDARIVYYPVENPSKRTILFDCNTTNIGEKYQLEGEAVHDITGYCLNKKAPE